MYREKGNEIEEMLPVTKFLYLIYVKCYYVKK